MEVYIYNIIFINILFFFHIVCYNIYTVFTNASTVQTFHQNRLNNRLNAQCHRDMSLYYFHLHLQTLYRPSVCDPGWSQQQESDRKHETDR